MKKMYYIISLICFIIPFYAAGQTTCGRENEIDILRKDLFVFSDTIDNALLDLYKKEPKMAIIQVYKRAKKKHDILSPYAPRNYSQKYCLTIKAPLTKLPNMALKLNYYHILELQPNECTNWDSVFYQLSHNTRVLLLREKQKIDSSFMGLCSVRILDHIVLDTAYIHKIIKQEIHDGCWRKGDTAFVAHFPIMVDSFYIVGDSAHKLSFLNPNISALKLRYGLFLSNNLLKTLPNGVFDLPIKKLDISNNKFKKLSNKVSLMHSLEIIDISYNPIQNTSKTLYLISKIPNIKHIIIKHLHSNNIQYLPNSFLLCLTKKRIRVTFSDKTIFF